ncbi:MAG: hypothetical protein JG759_405 [Thermoanaerobacter sp.]|jgi:hypothetical protein|nr:hypothetical protein [Thermoanaerobacter sp.]
MEEIRQEDIVINEEDIVEENTQETTEIQGNVIPLDRIIVGMIEKPILKIIDDEEKRKEFLYNYESQCLPILEAINFNDVLSRKLFSGKELTDNQVIAIGFGVIGITALVNALPYIKRKKKKQAEEGEKHEEDNKQEG